MQQKASNLNPSSPQGHEQPLNLRKRPSVVSQNINFFSVQQCPYCQEKDIKTILQGRDFETNLGEFDILECPKCQLKVTSPQPAEEGIGLLYQGRNTPDFPNVTGLTAALRGFLLRRRYAEVPSFDSIWVKWLGKYAFSLYLPRHLIHFDWESIRLLLKYEETFELRRYHLPILGRSLAYLTKRDIPNMGILGLASFPFQIIADMLFRRSTALMGVIRK